MARSLGLIAYLALAALGAAATRRRIARQIARGGTEALRLSETLGQASHRRPDGPLLWLHASNAGQEAAICDLIRRLGEALPGLSFLLTSDAPLLSGTLPDRCQHQLVPREAARPVADFLDHWHPEAGLWAGTSLRPALIHAAAERGVALALIDAISGPVGPRHWPRLAGATLRVFDHLLAADDRAAEDLIDAGANRARIELAGHLQEGTETPDCDLSERKALGLVLKARPVWLAAMVTAAEDEAVIAAQRFAQRLAHRLLLILVPDDITRGPALAERLTETGLSVSLRSVEGEPDARTEVFIADVEGELGLWYRLAPVTFLGGTLDLAGGGGRSPLEPAALGSAMLHGPGTGPHTATYARFATAAAARQVVGAADLGEALADLLSPDRAALMAHAAWRVSTLGAGLFERVEAFVTDALVQRAAP